MSIRVWQFIKEWMLGETIMVPVPTRAQSADIYRETIGVCPICRSSLSRHEIAALCSVVVERNSLDRRRHLEQLIEAHNWSEVTAFQEWRWDADVLQYHVLRCPVGGLALLALVFTYQIEDQDFLDDASPLPSEDTLELERLLTGKWLKFEA